MKRLLTGNEAIARGLYEAGGRFASAYPGTPSTEILENLPQYKEAVYSEWAPNEKVAAEAAYGASMAGARSLAAMKHVGLNVAADPLFTAAYNGVGAGFIIVSADDPGMHSSQNEQDNRHYAKAAKIPMLEPADSAECKDFVAEAFRISETFDTPVLLRVTTRISHSKSLVEPGERVEVPLRRYEPNIVKYVSTPANAMRHHPEVERRLIDMEIYSNNSPLNFEEMNGTDIGIVCASVCRQYAKDVFADGASYFHVGMSWPLPIERIRAFAGKVKTLYVIEELDPLMEDALKAAGIDCVGKAKTPLVGELNPQILAEVLLGERAVTKEVDAEAAARPPVLCAGCPHRGFFYTLAKGNKNKNYVIAGDIGCYTLGSAPPLSSIESCICMGGGFTVAAGMAQVFAREGDDRVVFGVMGDSTFMHSGITGAAEIIYNGAKVIPCVLDNSITAMTGHQDNPSTGRTLMGGEAPVISIEGTLRALGYEKVLTADPQDLAAMQEAVDEAVAAIKGGTPVAIVTKRPCVLIKGLKLEKGLCVVDTDECKYCKLCSKAGCPAVVMREKEKAAWIDSTLCTGCTVCMQVCPFGAISAVSGSVEVAK
ncbi:MAG: indolepyruvate ferredoxin oxidoreductase subunit alpha [Clostridiales Family XIII bacterium]|jgi:indolepyruvate ferredoxin oxidoreductase alpha subunit|nr:indolepyruvate ferredoxin oxidoreductase subunit alpha [Clostridiales Family XIII bacterium]